MLSTKYILHKEQELKSAHAVSRNLKSQANIEITNKGIYKFLRDTQIFDRYNTIIDNESFQDKFVICNSIVYSEPDECIEQVPIRGTYKLMISGIGFQYLIEKLPAYLDDKKINKRLSVKKKSEWEFGDELLPHHRIV